MPLINALKGALIGVALVIPGLSGSIFAVIVGLYEPLLAAIAQFKKRLAPSNWLFMANRDWRWDRRLTLHQNHSLVMHRLSTSGIQFLHRSCRRQSPIHLA